MLKRVKIQGYKSLVDVEVYLQPLSVLFGPNASGKSNFLDALQLLSRISNSNTLRVAFEPPYRGKPLESFTFGPNGIKDLLAQERVSFSIEVDIELSQVVIDTVNRQIQGVGSPKIIREGKEINAKPDIKPLHDTYLRYRIEIESLPKHGVLRIADEEIHTLDAHGELSNYHLSLDKNAANPLQSMLAQPPYFLFSPYVVALRQELASWFFFYLEPREYMRLPTPVKEVRHIGLRGEEISAFLNTLRSLDEVQFEAVGNALNMVIPSITGIDVSVNDLGEVELNLMEGQMPISSRVVSDGTLRILGLLALSGAKEKPSLIGFEEPENGIHPRRLSLIASLLQSRARHNTQVIVTTHSPILPDLIPHKFLYVCRKHQGRTSIEPFSTWELPSVDEALDDNEEITVSGRILRGDFDA